MIVHRKKNNFLTKLFLHSNKQYIIILHLCEHKVNKKTPISIMST